jgi:HSP20 family protein
MLLRTDPFLEFDRLTDSLFRTPQATSWMPMDGYRHGDVVTVEIDMPGVDPATIDLTVERNELKVEAERRRTDQEDAQFFIRERPSGQYSRRLWLGDNLDVEHIDAEYVNGVLVLRLPLHAAAKARKVEIRAGEEQKAVTSGP